MKNWKENLTEKSDGVSCFERRLKLVRLVLSRLERQPFRWTPLLRVLIQACGSPPRLYYVLRFLERNGFVQRISVGDKSHWSITEKGKELLRVLSVDKDCVKMHGEV